MPDLAFKAMVSDEADVETFLAKVPQPQQDTLRIVRERLRAVMPHAPESIYYGVPAFKVGRIGIAGYAAAKRHCSYFPMSGSVLDQLADDLVGYDWSKGTLRFPIDQPLPTALIAKLVATRCEQAGVTL